MAGSLSIEEVRNLDGLQELEEAWNRLVERADSPHLSSMFNWALSWWKHRSLGNQLFILVMKDGGRLVGIAPLMISDVR